MSNSKISALTGATTPLAGTEVLPIVQSSTTKQVSVANLTAGRAISATSVTASTGNFVVGTSGQGIDFSATPGTGTSELLADYEEGTFTPVLFGSTTAGAGTYSAQDGVYTKIGNAVYVCILFVWTAHTGTGNLILTGLPFSLKSNVYPSTACLITGLTLPIVGQVFIELTGGTSAGKFYLVNNGVVSAMPMNTTGTLEINIIYPV